MSPSLRAGAWSAEGAQIVPIRCPLVLYIQDILGGAGKSLKESVVEDGVV